MAKVIKGYKQLAIIVSQKEYDLLAALVGMTTEQANGGHGKGYDDALWKVLREHQVVSNKIAKITKSEESIDVLNREQEEY